MPDNPIDFLILRSSIIFSFFVVLGNVVIAFGADSYHAIVAGRFLFGLGGESLIVAQTTILVADFLISNF